MEVDQLGINVMLAERSGFRTDWMGCLANVSKPQIEDHEAMGETGAMKSEEASVNNPAIWFARRKRS